MPKNKPGNNLIVSIILPTYNVAYWLHDTVTSIQRQTLTSWEAIFVIDGSPDSSEAILRKFAVKDSRIRIIVQKNGGQGVARDRGAEAARGEFLFFLDPDDLLPPDALETAVNRAYRTAADLVVGDYIGFDDDQAIAPIPAKAGSSFQSIFSSLPDVFDREDIDDNVFYYSLYFMIIWLKLFRRDVWVKHKIRAPDGLKMGEDNIPVRKYCFLCSKISAVNSVLVYYRKRSGSSTTKRTRRSLDIFDSFTTSVKMYDEVSAGKSEKSLLLNAYINYFDQHLLHYTPLGYWIQFARCQQDVLKRINTGEYDVDTFNIRTKKRIQKAKFFNSSMFIAHRVISTIIFFILRYTPIYSIRKWLRAI